MVWRGRSRSARSCRGGDHVDRVAASPDERRSRRRPASFDVNRMGPEGPDVEFALSECPVWPPCARGGGGARRRGDDAPEQPNTRRGAVVDHVRAVLPAGPIQLEVPPQLPGCRPPLQRVRLRPRDSLRDAVDRLRQLGRPARAPVVRRTDEGDPAPPAALAAGGRGDRDPVRPPGARGEGDVRLGASPPPADLRRLGGRAHPGGREGRDGRGADSLLQDASRPRLQLETEVDGAHAGAAVLAPVPAELPEVQRADLGVSLVTGRPLRAAHHRAHRRRAAGRCPRHGRALLADAPGPAAHDALRHADDSGRGAGVREAVSRGRDHLRQPALDARRRERRPRQPERAARPQARGDHAGGAALP